ncbi:hypothetical protein MLD38_011522 [Melastoma candidum]|uniref:Uncharacterized protein n=1 Tax=Melastoma candidum TaxID=119954 RepID=A0ACB9R3E4_9MYRT|nr:hypothetical protein MLD38_011522 [Melastoma candidum]
MRPSAMSPSGMRKDGFNPSSFPPFKIADIRAAIPKHCWEKSVARSLGYVVWDLFVCLVLGRAAMLYLSGWMSVLWPVYWFAQGTMFWALFVLGHDCGHGSFSDHPGLNNVVGHLLHTIILVPYHGWRLSHKTHHNNHGHVENDESWVPLTEEVYNSLETSTRFLRFVLPFPIFAFPLYLWKRSPGKEGSHFNPYSKLFTKKDRMDVTISTLCWFSMAALLIYLCSTWGTPTVLKLYGIPYLIFVMWLDTVTYLHHHGHDEKLPWYRGKEWSYLRGGLTTVDRDYGMFNSIHHDIGTHVIHHLFPQIPHYHLVEATRASKAVMGKYYREPTKCVGPIPYHLIKPLVSSLRQDHFVSNKGDIVFYQSDPRFRKS